MDKDNIWELIEKQFLTYPQDFAGSGSTELVNKAEAELGIKFNNDYKEFLLKYGGACIGSKFIYGINKHRDMDKELNNVVFVTKFYRNQDWPDIDDWYIISDDFDGNPIGIDPEGKVWLSDHDSGFEKIKLADSFEEFLYKLHTETLYE